LIDDLWPALEPPRDFSSRVLAAMDGVARVGRGRQRLVPALAAVAGAAVLGLAVVSYQAARPRRMSHAIEGDLRAVTRQTVSIAGRAVAVAEPGADLGWSTTGGKIRVEQRSGGVFYRVEPGTDLVVATGAAEVRVTGTCFQVDVDGGASVRVFEGSVVVSNRAGAVALTAGERARVESGQAPALREGNADLLARQRRDRERVRQLERALREARDEPPGDAPAAGALPEHKALDFTPEERRAMAARCEFRYARPQHLIGHARGDLAARFALDERERAAVVQVMEDQRTQFIEELRALYVEIVGDRATALRLSPIALVDEINAKARPGEDVEARQRIFQEWSGQAQPPADLGARPAVERFWRLLSGATDTFIERLTPLVGSERARAIARGTVHDAVHIRGPCSRSK
jgi:hypothetical protein